jgi:hypothetical protein
MYASVLGISGALDLDVFEQPVSSDLVSNLLEDSVFQDFSRIEGGQSGMREFQHTPQDRSEKIFSD